MCWRHAEISFSRLCPECGAPQCNEQRFCDVCGTPLEYFPTIEEAGDLAVPNSEVRDENFQASEDDA